MPRSSVLCPSLAANGEDGGEPVGNEGCEGFVTFSKKAGLAGTSGIVRAGVVIAAFGCDGLSWRILLIRGDKMVDLVLSLLSIGFIGS